MPDTLKESVLVPEENVTVDFAVTGGKTFNICFKCDSFRSGCSGPNLAILGIPRACEFLQMTRTFLGYSYQQVADGTDVLGMPVSLATVKRILSGKAANPDFYSVTAISIFLLGLPDGKKHPCAFPDVSADPESNKQLSDALRDLERLNSDTEEYRAIIDNIHRSYKAEMDAIRAEAQKKIDYLIGACDRLRVDRDSWRAESNRWQAENERKGKLIDKHLDKMLGN